MNKNLASVSFEEDNVLHDTLIVPLWPSDEVATGTSPDVNTNMQTGTNQIPLFYTKPIFRSRNNDFL